VVRLIYRSLGVKGLSLFCIPEILHPFIGIPDRNPFTLLNNLPGILLLENYYKFRVTSVFVSRLHNYAIHLYLQTIKSQQFYLIVV